MAYIKLQKEFNGLVQLQHSTVSTSGFVVQVFQFYDFAMIKKWKFITSKVHCTHPYHAKGLCKSEYYWNAMDDCWRFYRFPWLLHAWKSCHLNDCWGFSTFTFMNLDMSIIFWTVSVAVSDNNSLFIQQQKENSQSTVCVFTWCWNQVINICQTHPFTDYNSKHCTT